MRHKVFLRLSTQIYFKKLQIKLSYMVKNTDSEPTSSSANFSLVTGDIERDIESLICSYYLNAAPCTLVWVDVPRPLWNTGMLLGR